MKKELKRAMYVAPDCECIDLSPHSLLAGLSAEGALDGFDIDTNPYNWGEEYVADTEL